MDKEEKELLLLGLFHIWKRSFKIISSWNQTVLRVALALTLPLSIVYLAHIEVNHLLSQNITRTLNTLATTPGNTTTYALEYSNNHQDYETNSRALLRDLARYALFQIAYIVFWLVSSLLPAGIIYTCICSTKKVTVKEVMFIIPKVWKRLIKNILCVMVVKFVYELVFGIIVFVIFLAYPIDSGNYIMKYNLPDILCSVGVWYMDVIWQLANIISVIEKSCGFQVLRKSQKLIKGKMGSSFGIMAVNTLLFRGTLWLFNRFVVVDRGNVGLFGRVGFSVMILQLLSIVILLGVVVRTMLYLVCKSYHNEQTDEFTLTDHLQVHHGEGYILLKPKEGQLMDHA